MRPTFFVNENVLSPSECETISAYGDSRAVAARLGSSKRGSVNPFVRNSKACFFRADEKKPDAVEAVILKAVEAFLNSCRSDFGLDINQVEPIQFCSYTGPYGHYAWHYDVGSLGNHRVVSASLELTAPDKYIGGGLQMAELKSKGKPTLGAMTTFPSLLLHRAKPVFWGTRRALVMWGYI